MDAQVELDPDRSVSAWLAVSVATLDNGSLHAVPGSHHFGYLPFSSEYGAERGRADQATGFTADASTPPCRFAPAPPCSWTAPAPTPVTAPASA
nr:phytanoyl-CoA dioxygenase family protein [Kitasatospora sp. MAA19]